MSILQCIKPIYLIDRILNFLLIFLRLDIFLLSTQQRAAGTLMKDFQIAVTLISWIDCEIWDWNMTWIAPEKKIIVREKSYLYSWNVQVDAKKYFLYLSAIIQRRKESYERKTITKHSISSQLANHFVSFSEHLLCEAS